MTKKVNSITFRLGDMDAQRIEDAAKQLSISKSELLRKGLVMALRASKKWTRGRRDKEKPSDRSTTARAPT
jgi:hypothetical protein